MCTLIAKHQMTWEMVPAEMLDKRQVWATLAGHMPIMALVRNLATLTRLGVIAPMQSAAVCQRLGEIGTTVHDGQAGEDASDGAKGGCWRDCCPHPPDQRPHE